MYARIMKACVWCLKPLLDIYRNRTNTIRFRDLVISVPREVFHPLLHFSTVALLRYLDRFNMEDKAFLELGAGSGLLSLIVAKRGARVTATDISTIAIQALDINSVYNQVQIQIVRSDVFQDITHQPFDIIAVNPPYYPKDPSSEQELAWYCGSEYQFFHKFFGSLPNFIHSQTQVIMVLSEVAPKGDVRNICHSYGFKMIEKETKKVLWEKQSIYHCQ